jgi:hypothetical protein
LGIIKDYRLIQCYKGTCDEVNNSLLDTYDYHDQVHPQPIIFRLERDVDLKVLRSVRILLAFLSRTKHRVAVKKALYSNVHDMINVLRSIDYTTISDLGKRNVNILDYWKIVAFQLAQTLSLMEGIELYTKEGMTRYNYRLYNFINRQQLTSDDLSYINEYKNYYLDKVVDYIQTHENMPLKEY